VVLKLSIVFVRTFHTMEGLLKCFLKGRGLTCRDKELDSCRITGRACIRTFGIMSGLMTTNPLTTLKKNTVF
jgi:hypothetical protein